MEKRKYRIYELEEALVLPESREGANQKMIMKDKFETILQDENSDFHRYIESRLRLLKEREPEIFYPKEGASESEFKPVGEVTSSDAFEFRFSFKNLVEGIAIVKQQGKIMALSECAAYQQDSDRANAIYKAKRNFYADTELRKNDTDFHKAFGDKYMLKAKNSELKRYVELISKGLDISGDRIQQKAMNFIIDNEYFTFIY